MTLYASVAEVKAALHITDTVDDSSSQWLRPARAHSLRILRQAV